jgi:putative effector of murein hydrolase LrgA (UPF0299 family)
MTTIKGRMETLKNHLHKYQKRNFGETDKGVYLVVILLTCLLTGIVMSQMFPQTIPAFVVGVLFAFLLLHLAVAVVSWLFDQFLKIGLRNLIYRILIIGICAVLATFGNLGYSIISSLVLGALSGIVVIWFSRTLWALLHNRVHTPTILISLILSGALVVAGVILMAGNGFKDDYVAEYLKLNTQVQQADDVAGFEKQFQSGNYTVECLEYSPNKGADIRSDTMDLSFSVENPEGLDGLRRKEFFDYDVKKTPIAGKVWYPKETSGCPVVFMIHGNHNITTKSYLGYEYLGRYLASYGYVVVSVDENVLNDLSHENDARAILLLENIKELQRYNMKKGNPLYGKMDYQNIALAGHSRGGEAVATACLFNRLGGYPENGMHSFDYHFVIRSVLAIAPTVDQYMPADHEVELQDVNYMLIQGANDQDVSTNMGNTQYSHVNFTGEGDYIKSSLYIAGANHGQFNSLWGRYDLPQPASSFLNVADFLSQNEQQDILKIYVKTFLDQTMKSNTEYADLLTNYAKYSRYLPKTLYIQQYQKSKTDMICDFEEDSDLQTATKEEVRLDADDMRTWTEEMSHYSDENKQERHNYILHLGWKNTSDAAYHIMFRQPANLNGKSIAFDICDLDERLDGNLSAEKLDPVLQVTDEKGHIAYLDTTGIATIYPSLPVKLGKIQYLSGQRVFKHEYQTVCAPVSAFSMKNGTIDWTQIQDITITFPNNKDGKVGIDNICLTSFYKNED